MNNRIRILGLIFVGMVFVWGLNTVSAQTLNAPSDLTLVEANPFSLDISWTDNSDNEQYFLVEILDGDWYLLGSATANTTTYTITGLICNTSYSVRIRAYLATEIYSDYSNIITTSTAACPPPPTPPSNLTLVSTTSSEISISWQDNASDEDYYVIESDMWGYWESIDLVEANITSFTLRWLDCNRSYNLRVRAYRIGDDADSDPTDVLTVSTDACPPPPAAPSDLALVSTTQLTAQLTWVDNSSNESSFKLERRQGAGTWTQIATISADITSYTASGLTCNTSYEFRVVATGQYGDSEYSNILSVTTSACPPPSAAPTALYSTGQTRTSISLAWTNNATDHTMNYAARSSDGGITWLSVNVSASNSTYTFVALTCGTSYQFRVWAYRSTDNTSSDYSNVISVSTAECIPATPTNLTSPSKTHTSIDLTWTDNATNETAYRLERSTDNGFTYTEIAQLPADTTSYSNTGLLCGKSYRYRVRAYRSTDNVYSGFSTSTSATTNSCPTAPAAPSSLTANPIGMGIQLNWTDNATTETNYLLERSSNGGTNWTQIADLAANTNTYTDIGIICGQSYTYRLRTYNNAGVYSAYSANASATKTCLPMACTLGTEFNTGIVGSYQVGPVAMSSDGSRVALTYGLPTDSTNLYDVASQNQIAHFERGMAVDLDADGSHAVMRSISDLAGQNADGSEEIFLWNNGSYTQITNDSLNVNDPQISDDGSTIVFTAFETASFNHYIYIWDAVNGLRKLIPNAIDASNSGYPVVVSGDASTIAFVAQAALSGNANLTTHQIYLWNAINGLQLSSPLQDTVALDFWAYSLSINADGTRISFAARNNYLGMNADRTFEVFLWDIGNGWQQITNDNLDANLALAMNASGERLFLMSPSNLAGTNADNSLEYFFWDSSSGFSQITDTNYQNWTSFGTALSADGSVLGLITQNTVLNAGDDIYPHLRLYIADCNPAPALTRPASPTALSVTAGTGTNANLTWTDNAIDETGYRIQVSTNNGTSWSNVATIAANSTTYTDINVPTMTCGTDILYRVQAYKNTGNIYSAPSNQASFATLCEPRTPTNLRVLSSSPTRLQIGWDDNSQVEEWYIIDHSLDGINWTNLSYLLSPNTTSYNHTGLYCNSVHYYRVRIWDFQSSQYSAYSDIFQATVPDCTETLPALTLTVDNFYTTTNSIAFNSSPSLSGNLSGFTEFSSDNGISWTVLPYPQELSCGTSYQFRGRTYIYYTGEKTPIYYITASTKPCFLDKPDLRLVTRQTGISVDASSFVNFVHSINILIQVERSEDGGTSWTYLGIAYNGSYPDTSVVCETNYQYRARLYDSVNELYSDYSSVKSATAYTCPPEPPTNLVAVVNAHSVSLTWDDNADDEIYYQVYRDSTATQLPSDSESYNDLWITCGSSRRYWVRAYSSLRNQYSANSNEVTINFAPCESQQTGTNLQVTTSAEGTDGVCGYDHCTLHEAITRANNLSSATITLVDGIYYGGWPRLNGNSTLIGVSPETTILEGEDSYPWVLAVEMGNANLKNLSLRNAQIGLYAQGTVSLENVSIEESAYYGIQIQSVHGVNLTLLNSVIQNLDGGALPIMYDTNNGTLSIEGSSIINNQTGGGTVIQFGSSYVTPRVFNLENSTISNNQSSTATKTGAFRSLGMPVLITLSSNTIANNAAGLFNIANASSTITMNGNLLSNCDMTDSAISTITGDYNLLGNNVNCNFSGSNNLLNVNPLLLPLADNGGLGLTHAFDLSSPALNGVPLEACTLSEDQRGELRPQGNACDIGAIELAYLDKPSSLTMSDSSTTSISLSWVDNSNEETNYLIERSDDGITWIEIDRVVADSSSYINTGLDCSSTYDYRVRAYKADEIYSAYSNVISVSTDICPPLNAPTALSITGTSQTSISLAWTDNSTYETNFRLERSSNGGTTWTEIQSLAADSISHTDSSLTCNTGYSYRLRAYRSGDNQYSSYSNVVNGTTALCPPPNAPTGLVVTSTGHTNVNLAWTDNSSDEAHFALERSVANGNSWTEIAQAAANSTSYNDTSALCNTSYDYRLRAFRSADSQHSTYSNVVTATTDICITLNAASDIQQTANSQTGMSLSWTDNSLNESGYEIERSADGSTWQLLSSLPADSTSYTDSGLGCSTGYYYRVRSNHLGTGAYSPYATSGSLMTAACPPLVASALSTTGTTQNSISLSWTVDNNATSFTLAFYNGSTWQNLGIFASSTTTYTHTGLLCGNNYQYRITTFRSNDSALLDSDTHLSSTAACPPLLAPNAPVLVDAQPAMIRLQIPTMPATATSMSLERSADGVTWTNLGAASNFFNDTGVLCGTSYQYRLVAYRSTDGASATSPNTVALTDMCPIPTTLGIYRNGLWLFVESNNTTVPVMSFNNGDAQWQPLVGDWDGDGIDGIGIYRNGEFILRNSAAPDAIDTRFMLGNTEGGWKALVGDWNGDGIDTVGIYKAGLFILSDDNQNFHYHFNFGDGQTDWQAVAGDWNADGRDGIGLYRNGRWLLTDDVNNPTTGNQSISYGPQQAGWIAIVGDWNGDGFDSIGFFNNGLWRMRVNSIQDVTELSVNFGQAGDIPLSIFDND